MQFQRDDPVISDLFYVLLLCVHSSFVIISVGKRELFAFLCLSSWCLLIVVCMLFLTIPRVYLQFVIVVFSDHSHLLFLLAGWNSLHLKQSWVGALLVYPIPLLSLPFSWKILHD